LPSSEREPREAHHYREVAESFGADAARYDRARPSYPGALVERIIAASPGRDVLDAGCGTGIAARLFQAAGCRVLGVDPDPRMADLARRSGLEAEVATFEAWEVAGRTFDAVIAAQAWHWIDPVAGAAQAARALRPGRPGAPGAPGTPGGRLAVFWNAAQLPPEVAEGFASVYRRVETGLPFSPSGRPVIGTYLSMCATAAGGMRQAGGFGEPEEWRFDWDRPYTRDEWLDQVPTIGGHSQIPPPRLEELLAGLGAVIDEVGGRFTMRYATVAVTAARTG
jgi:SAM-dependent methyltransferase